MKLILFAILLVLVASGPSFASAAQLSWDARTSEKAIEPKFTFQKTITIDYSDGGSIADQLRGKKESVQFRLDGSSLGSTIEYLNKKLEQSGSSARISDLQIDYSAELTGYQSQASIEYDVMVTPKIEKFLIQEYSAKSLALLDASWRGLTISEPIISEVYDITKPISLLDAKFPLVSEQIRGTDAEELLSQTLIDAYGLEKLRISQWHSLFDPTAIIQGAIPYGFKGDVVTTFSMGESTIFHPTREQTHQVILSLDKKYIIATFEAADSATLFVTGYANAGMLGGYEIIEAGPKQPAGVTPPDAKSIFPIMVMYGMAGVAAAGAGGFFWWSSKRAKKEQSLGQTGIDPSQLHSVETSSASGEYKTNRGEAQLKSQSEYPQTKSVYRGALPKGWD